MERESRFSESREALDRHYPVLVIDPYAVNIKDQGPNFGDVRLSFYSAFVAHTAREIIEAGLVDEVIVFDDASFGPDYASAGDLTVDYFTRDRKHSDGSVRPIIDDKTKVHLYKGDQLARTPTQVQKVAEYLRERDMEDQEVLYLGWEYHRKRVENHGKGFGVNLRFVAVEQIHKIYDPDFDLDRLMEVLPLDEIEKMEAGRRKISKLDTKGVIPGIIQSFPVIGGPRMLDNKRNPDGTLSFDYRKGTDRLKELRLI